MQVGRQEQYLPTVSNPSQRLLAPGSPGDLYDNNILASKELRLLAWL